MEGGGGGYCEEYLFFSGGVAEIIWSRSACTIDL